MSKHNHYTNYSNMSMPNVGIEPEPTAVVNTTVTAPVFGVDLAAVPDEVSEPEAEAEPTKPEPKPTKPEPKAGIVTANKLNIRKLPALNAEVVAVVDKNTTLMIDPEYETVEWFKVVTAAGIEGYCMKKFVEVK